MIEKALSSIDLLGFPIILSFSRSSKVQSSFGGIWSLLFLCFAIFCLYNSGYELFAKKKPQVNQGSIFTEDGRPMEISSKTLPTAFFIRTNTGDMGSVQCQYKIIYLLDTSSATNLENQPTYDMEHCTYDHFDGLLQKVPESTLNTYYCLPKISQFDVPYGFVVMGVCPQQPGLEQFLQNGPTATLLYPKYGFTLQNYNRPAQTYLGTHQISLKNTKTTTAWQLNHINVTSDDGWLTSNLEQTKYIKVTADSSQDTTEQGSVGVVYQFINQKEEFFYSRSYMKIQNVLAEVGGITSSVFAVMLILVTPFARIKFCEAFINEMFEAPRDKKDINQDTNKKDKKNSKISSRGSSRVEPMERGTLTMLEMPKRYSNEPGSTLKMTKEKSGPVTSSKTQNSESPCKSPLECNDDSSMSPLVLFDRKTNTQTVQPEITLFPQASTPKSIKDSYLDYEEGSKTVRATTLDDQNGRFEHKNPFSKGNNKNGMEILEKQGSETHNILKNVQISPESPVIEINEEVRKEKDDSKPQDDNDGNQNKTDSKNKDKMLEKNRVFGTTVKEKEDSEQHHDIENVAIAQASGAEEDDMPVQADDNQKSDAASLENKNRGLLNRLRKRQKPKVINITFFEYLKSFVSKSKPLKEKMGILNEGFSALESRLDIFNLLKKLRDIDKVKGLVFDKDQLFLFDRLPRSDIMNQANHWFQEEYLTDYEVYKEANVVEELKIKEQIKESQKRIEDKPQQTDIDRKILSLS